MADRVGIAANRGADAIVMIEQTQPAQGGIDVRRAATPGQFISSAGSDMERGETVLRAGVEITAREIVLDNGSVSLPRGALARAATLNPRGPRSGPGPTGRGGGARP